MPLLIISRKFTLFCQKEVHLYDSLFNQSVLVKINMFCHLVTILFCQKKYVYVIYSLTNIQLQDKYVLPISYNFTPFLILGYLDGAFYQVTCPLCVIFTRIVTLFAYIFFNILMLYKVVFNSSLLM